MTMTARDAREGNDAMTYCLGMLLDAGLVMMADTRTNAGVDNFSIYKKLHLLADGPDRAIYACTAGNLSISQTAISLVCEGLRPASEAEELRTLGAAPTMFRAAELMGEAIRIASGEIGAALAVHNIAAGASTLIGGRIGNARPELYLVYEAGNFIQCKPDSPFFQIGETKYGRPILDRELAPQMSLAEAVKFGCLSFDATIASNLGVARPIDLMVMPADPAAPILTRRIERQDDYFDDLAARWGEALHQASKAIPNPPFIA
jgi:putative proteasome-type protease